LTDGTAHTLCISEALAPVISTQYDGPLGETSLNEGGQSFDAVSTPNSTVRDFVFRRCPDTVGDGGTLCEVDPASSQIGFPNPEGGGNAQHYSARSRHPGGVHAAMCDGSVHFFTDEIDLKVWRNLSTSKGGEVEHAF
jgi:prepilin-type processing-associated H-X9-DG protein